jgi:GNAT superfamily N-acetyltransferase
VSGPVIRPLRADERPKWDPLWLGYQRFYKTDIPAQVSDLTWARFHDPAEPVHLLGAFDDDDQTLLGIVHYIFHRSCWTAGPYCYLQDLFTVPEARGKGIGRGLIEAVYAKAAEAGASRVWWLTQETNYAGRILYDQVADRPGFIQYRKLL